MTFDTTLKEFEELRHPLLPRHSLHRQVSGSQGEICDFINVLAAEIRHSIVGFVQVMSSTDMVAPYSSKTCR